MSHNGNLIVDVVEIRRRSGSRRPLVVTVHLDDLAAGERCVVDGELKCDLIVEAITEGVSVVGTAAGVSRVPCRRCLEPVDQPLVAEIQEIFVDDATDGETWPIEHERIDLEPPLREAALLSLPLVPLCRDDCDGPEPARFPTGPADDSAPDEAPPLDDRWAVLDELRFD